MKTNSNSPHIFLTQILSCILATFLSSCSSKIDKTPDNRIAIGIIGPNICLPGQYSKFKNVSVKTIEIAKTKTSGQVNCKSVPRYQSDLNSHFLMMNLLNELLDSVRIDVYHFSLPSNEVLMNEHISKILHYAKELNIRLWPIDNAIVLNSFQNHQFQGLVFIPLDFNYHIPLSQSLNIEGREKYFIIGHIDSPYPRQNVYYQKKSVRKANG